MRIATKTALADTTGIIAIALASGVVTAGLNRMHAVSQPWVILLIAVPFLIGASLWVCQVSNKTLNWGIDKWGYALMFTLVAGAISFAIDVFAGSTDGQHQTLLEAAAHAGSPFGFPLTVLVCPVGTLVAFGSCVRCVMLRVFRAEL
jgi:hypothetical protein